ncbi:M48 family metallopeptidase [Gilvimarinus chinensis]|uniref:M48 family metallopeptidase n=1 Tax=Gilvimarinus chinensis TaxID=396005 RepID=UPI00038105F8|nr:M48 family metallopeptidase [Gilvimarinus chinensis]
MDIHGLWYSGKDSAKREAILRLSPDGEVQVIEQVSQQLLAQAGAAGLSVSSRLGNTARFIRFADGAAFETTENDAVDEMQRQWQPGLWSNLLHTLESHLGLVLVATLIVAVFVWGSVVYGIPAASKAIAYQLPQDTLNTVSKESMKVMDRVYFSPSQLSAEKKEALQQAFAPVLAEYPELPLKVLFRSGGERIGANAFALPDGTIVFTDEMIELAESNEELLTVLAHEIGHVELRHSLRSVIQNAVLGFAYVTLVGDGTAMADLLLGLPVLATTLSYSRDHETEADQFSAQYLDSAGIDRQAFVDLMSRLGETMHCQALLEDAADVDEKELSDAERLRLCEELAAEADEDESSRWFDYLSTHPNLDERLKDFMH